MPQNEPRRTGSSHKTAERRRGDKRRDQRKYKKGDVNDMMCTMPDAAHIRCVSVETTVVKNEKKTSLWRG
jgi:hypothetical protein